MNIKPYYDYFKYVIEHKKNIFKTAWKRKLYLHAIFHDMSKFSPQEFIPYAKFFYIDKEKYKAEFDKAWEHHYKNNPHHWNYWLDDNGNPTLIPNEYLEQMIVDWEAMSLKFGGNAQEYYLKNYKKIKLDDNTRLRLEYFLGLNDSMMYNYGNTLEQFVSMYTEDKYNSYFGFIKDKYGIDTYALLKPNKK